MYATPLFEAFYIIQISISSLTVDDVLSLHHLLGVLLDTLLVHRQTPGLGLQVLGVGLQLSPHCYVVDIWRRRGGARDVQCYFFLPDSDS